MRFALIATLIMCINSVARADEPAPSVLVHDEAATPTAETVVVAPEEDVVVVEDCDSETGVCSVRTTERIGRRLFRGPVVVTRSVVRVARQPVVRLRYRCWGRCCGCR